MKEENYRDKRVFVLMGHTERMQGRYASFVEAVIPVKEMEFSGNIPKWDSATWSEVFHEIKRMYEDMIIVGWALDIKGMSPKLTPDLERVHREHFGGVHQLLFLLDTMDCEENFYIYKENKLVAKEGFYIYHKVRVKKESAPMSTSENVQQKQKNTEVEVSVEIAPLGKSKKGKYREFLLEGNGTETKVPEKEHGNFGIAAAVAMLVFVIGVGVYENSDNLFGDSIQTNLIPGVSEEMENTQEETETSSDEIEVEIVPGTE